MAGPSHILLDVIQGAAFEMEAAAYARPTRATTVVELDLG